MQPSNTSEYTASAIPALFAEWIKKQISTLHKDDILPSAPFQKVSRDHRINL